MLLFDSSTMAADDRCTAIRDLLADRRDPVRFGTLEEADPIDLVFRAWSFGPGATLVYAAGPGIHLRHSEPVVASGRPTRLCLVTQPTGLARLARKEAHDMVGPQTLSIYDMRGDYDYRWSGPGSSASYQLSLDALGLLRTDVAVAIPRLRLSPLYEFVRDHVADVLLQAQTETHLDPSIHQATVDLARALIVSVLTDEPHLPTSDDDALWAAAQVHIRRHLSQHTLGDEAVAAALHTSPTRLRQVAARRGIVLTQYLRQQRTGRARAELAEHRERHGLGGQATLASTAARWGFRDADDLLESLAET